MSEDLKSCPKCQSPYGYPTDGPNFMCPECGNEWNPDEKETEIIEPEGLIVKDSNGQILSDGDSVVLIKNLPVKGSSGSLKAGTKVKNIKLKEGDHNIDCKIDGFGAMALKSEFVRKA